LDQLIQLPVSVYYNQNLTKKRKKDKKTPWPNHSSQGVHPKFATIVDRRGTSTGNAQKGDSPGDSPSPHQDLAPSAKVTTGGLSAPVSKWKARSHLLWIDGFQGLLYRLHFLTSMLRSLR
jgi:hypothetical protein